MTKTRRQSKAKAAAQAAEAESQPSSPLPSQLPFTLDIPDDIDTEVLALLLPEADLETPSKDAILALYRLVAAQAQEAENAQREAETLKADVEKRDIELDQAVQDKETAVSELESALELAREDLKQAKQEKDEIAAARAALQTQLSSLSTAESASHSEVETLKHKIEDTEREKRDLIGVVSRLKEDGAQRDEEIQTLRSNLKQSRQDYQALETQLREVRSTETSAKFKLETLTQQLDLAKTEGERVSADLTSKTDDFAKYRRSKHAELVQLQASHDSLSQTHAATESSLKALQSAHTAQSHQLTQALARIQDLNGRFAEQEATFTSEVASLKRLIKVLEERDTENKRTVETIEREYETVNERVERREAVLQEEIEAQMQRAVVAEKKAAELQKVMDRLDRGEFTAPSAPGTPARGPSTPARNGTPDFLTQGMMGLSPTVAMASRAQKTGKTFTEVYADYVKLQEDFSKKSMEYEHMERTLSAVLAQIEERAPILAQQRQEYERLQSESAQLASQLAQAISERDMYATAAEERGQKLKKSIRENELLQQQLNDLGRQVQNLLKELGRLQDPSIPSDRELEDDPSTQPAQNIEDVISNNLVLFRSIPALQEQNQKLLKIARELGAKMEEEEREYREDLEKEQVQAVYEAHEAIRKLQDELEAQKRTIDIKTQAYNKELEALKGTLAKERAMGSRSNGAKGVNGRGSDLADGATDSVQELAEVQNQFEAYKAEMGEDSIRLREELLVVQRETGQLGAALAKANAKVEYLNDRNRMLQDQTTMQGREIENLGRRNQDLYDQYTRIDIECNRVSEDLSSAKGVGEQLRNECANLRAEKRIWESVQGRLTEENRTLAIERTQLSDLMANVQRMHSDLERSNENDRKRLESQIRMLEGQTQDLRTQLGQERDSIRHLALQKDIELKELRNRIDKDSQEYSKTREALVKAETSQKHLQDQVDQLTKQLQGNEEKLAVYERRSSAVNGASQAQNQDLNREQQLEAEVAELRSSLKVAEVELASARSHVQQFKEISQASEGALASLNATYDDYKSATEAQLAMRESDLDALRNQLESVQKEMASVNEKHADLQRTLETERIAWVNDKRLLEGAIVDMTTSEKSSESERASHQQEVRQLEERAKAADERYSREVIAHAESIKNVENLRTQLAKAKATARDSLAASETAQAKLATSETSWKQQKDALDKEVADLNTRCKDLASQNNLLHQHLESVSSQAARIRQAADSSTTAETSTADDSEVKVSELRSVVTYLRKEKEIVDLQLELSKQESTRLKTQIDYLSQSLEETRKTLSEERERAVEAAASETQHAELVERINQLTILRESNATLRAESEAHAKKARTLDIKLRQLTTELDPVKEQLREALAEVEAKNQQVQRLENESKRWQERNTQLLSKYDRIDPAEVQTLKDEIEALKSEKNNVDQATSERDQANESKISQLEASLQRIKGFMSHNNDVSKRKFATYEATISDLEGQITTLTTERDSLKVQVENQSSSGSSREQELTAQIETLTADKASLEKALADEKTKALVAPVSVPADASPEQAALIASLTTERDNLLAEKATWIASTSNATAPPSTGPQQSEAEKAELVKARDEAFAKFQSATETISKLTQEVAQLKHSNETFKARIADLTRARQADASRAASQQEAAVSAAVEKVKAEVQASVAPDAAKHAEELRALEESLQKKHGDDLQKAIASASASAATATQPPTEASHEAIAAAVATRERELQTIKEKEVLEAVERGRMEQIARGKLKDQQLVRAQNRVKELEVQIQECKRQGFIPATPTTAHPPPNATAGPSTSTASAGTATAQRGGTPVARGATRPISGRTSVGPGAATSALPQRPGTAHPHPQGAAVRGRGGAPRGGVVRPVPAQAVGLAIRGAAPAAATTGQTTGASTAAGVSIMGAATKRSREEGEVDDSLAKRLKPADGVVTPSASSTGAAAAGASKPVQLKRDRVT